MNPSSSVVDNCNSIYGHHNEIAQEVNRLNNVAVYSLLQKRYTEACRSFLNGIYLLKQIVLKKNERDPTTATTTTCINSQCLFVKVNHLGGLKAFESSIGMSTRMSGEVISEVDDSMKIDDDNSGENDNDQESNVGYGKPFIFSSPLFMTTYNTSANFTRASMDAHFAKLSFTLIYNFALCQHLQAEEESQDDCLSAALSLYEGAYTLFLDQQDVLGLSMLHTMALQNNLGQVYQSLGRHELAQEIFEDLLTMIMYVRIAVDEDDLLCKDEINGFLSSVSCLILQGKESAPAA